MSTQNTEPSYQYQPLMPVNPPQAPMPVKKKRKWLMPLLLAVALLLGAGMGSASAAAKPAEIQIQEKIVEKEKRVNVEVPVTPDSCSTAFGYAEDVFTSSASTVGILSETLQAAGRLDAAAIRESSPKLDAETAKLKILGPQYRSARDSCLGK